MSKGKVLVPKRAIRAIVAGTATLALLIVALPSYAANPQSGVFRALNDPNPTALGAPGVPDATCPPDGQCFADVVPDNPFYTFVNRIYQQDLVAGYQCGSPEEPCDPDSRPYYRPVNTVTRQQMAKFIDNARHLPGIDIQVSSGPAPISAHNELGTATVGTSTSGVGVYGQSASFYGVDGYSPSGTGVGGLSDSGTGVHGITASGTGYGVWGTNTSGGDGVYSESSLGYGVYGFSTSTAGGAGVKGRNDSSNGYGVSGSAQMAGG